MPRRKENSVCEIRNRRDGKVYPVRARQVAGPSPRLEAATGTAARREHLEFVLRNHSLLSE